MTAAAAAAAIAVATTLAATVAMGLAAAPAAAQTSAGAETAFSVERLMPPPGRAPFLGGDDGDLLPRGALAFSATASLASRPLLLRRVDDGSEASEPVRLRFGLDLGAAIGLGRRYQLGAALPLVLQSGDRLQGIGLDERGLDRAALGDLRLQGKVRLVGRPGDDGLAAAVALTVGLPTGDDGDFAGEKGVTVGWSLLGSWRRGGLAAAIELGPRFRGDEVVFLTPSRPHGNELVGGLAAAARLPLPWRAAALSVVAEYAAVRGDATTGDNRGPSPQEARLGLRLALPCGWSVTAAAGAGTTPDEVGSPEWRAILALGHTAAPVSDLDRDGVPDRRDACPRDPEDADGFADTDGCPDPDDDGDGIPDADDLCPRQAEDLDGWRDQDGCPDNEQPGAPRST
jgi:hypothetical protein